ncbi:translation initiation factor 5B [Rhodotorula toruloides]|uniref:Eukaryotic translation initiation factor 5B n=1 Tax=Rhodotorula toruloides TaxID=5286 RepID=A0A511KCX2_RHOTO|nr:translation initiation factor 5B [Rhodotorula toruloides]
MSGFSRPQAKKEQLKREGKLLTPKQKAERAAAEARRQALLAAGNVTIAGLQEKPDRGPKKVSYGKRERAGGDKPQQTESPAESKPASPEPPKEEIAKPAPAAEEKDEEEEDVKDSWDASSDDEKEDVKDSWDASSDEEGEKTEEQKSAIVAKPATKGKSAAANAKGKAAAEEASEEEEDTDEESDSGSDDESDSDEDSDEDSEEEMTAVERQEAKRKAEAKARRLARDEQALAERSTENLRSPICVIMGHVDTGKTKLLDKIRQTNVQEGEAGGITQQIGATYFPMDAIQKRTRVLGDEDLKEYKLPGLLVIDTPGHESFTNLRQRGSSLCNIAILVVDIMHGLEPQTLESIRLLREGKTPFIVALNKIDRLYGWNAMKDGGFRQTLAQQERPVQREFEKRLNETIVAFAEQGLNAVPYYDNKNFAKYVSLVPTSAHTGEGVPDLLMLLVKLTQERMANNLMYISTLQCTVLEVKVIEGLGTTIDVVLVNGYLHEGDKIVLCGLNGAIVTQVRALLTPQPMKELRIKGQYVHHKQIKAAMGIKIVAPDLEKAIAGSRLLVCGEDDDEDELREEVMSDLTNLLNSVDTSGRGVFVQASTLGSLEALLEFLKSDAVKIPVAGINIGPVHKKDVMRCATMLERAPELAVILCFDVAVDKDAERQAEELGVKIFKADIIYHLFDQFMVYKRGVEEKKEAEAAGKAVFPCRLKILACFAQRDPIILGCDILDGTLRIGTPLCIVKTDPKTKKKEVISLGKVTSLEINHKSKDIVKRHEVGAGVAVKIEHAAYESAKQYGRHFDDKDEVVSMVSRESIDVLKDVFRKQVSMDEWRLIKALKGELGIP